VRGVVLADSAWTRAVRQGRAFVPGRAHSAYRPFCCERHGVASQLKALRRAAKAAHAVARQGVQQCTAASGDDDSAGERKPAARGVLSSWGAPVRQAAAAAVLSAALLAGAPHMQCSDLPVCCHA
jgi:endogenous inhibitor of DNA gyrase (YacG/DUF329 family)